MSLEKRILPNRLTVQWSLETGLPGMDFSTRTVITEGDTVLSDTSGPQICPSRLTGDELAAYNAVFGDTAPLYAQINVLSSALTLSEIELAKVTDQRDDAQTDLAALKSEMEALLQSRDAVSAMFEKAASEWAVEREALLERLPPETVQDGEAI